MFAILAEDDTDAEVLKRILRRRLQSDRIPVKQKGYEGCAPLCRKGARDVRRWMSAGVTHFIICHDADGEAPEQIRKRVVQTVLEPSGFGGAVCIAVPVEEIEAWMIADEAAINAVFRSFDFQGHPKPESIPSPKEWLRKQSRAANGKPLYSTSTFNPAIAKHLRLDVVAAKCPSFKAFMDWVDALAL